MIKSITLKLNVPEGTTKNTIELRVETEITITSVHRTYSNETIPLTEEEAKEFIDLVNSFFNESYIPINLWI